MVDEKGEPTHNDLICYARNLRGMTNRVTFKVEPSDNNTAIVYIGNKYCPATEYTLLYQSSNKEVSDLLAIIKLVLLKELP